MPDEEAEQMNDKPYYRLRLIFITVVIFMFMAVTVTSISAAVIRGTVYNVETKEPVPFATVRVEGTGRSMLANENGDYRLSLPAGTYHLKFSHVAYYSQRLVVEAHDSLVVQEVYLHPAIIEMPGMKVYERAYDPAQSIIREAIAHKDELLAKIRAYRFDAYSKLVVRDTAKDDSSNIILIQENRFTSYWEYPDRYKEHVTARKYACRYEGMEVLAPLGELTDFNKNRLDFGEYSVVSPTAKDALDHYNYYLLDTIYIDSMPVFRLEIEPKNDYEPLFAGIIDIADSSFAVVGVDVGFNEAFDFPNMHNARYFQHYARFENEYWMPVEIRFHGVVDVPLPGIPTMSFDYIAALHNFTFNTTHPAGTFDEYWFELDENADDVDSAAWNAGQLIPLTPDETQAYRRIDSLRNAPKPLSKKLLRLGLGALFVASGYKEDIFHFNRVEGAYLGIGLSPRIKTINTSFSLRTGYAFSGKFWQYRFNFATWLSKRRRLSIGGEYHDEITRRPTIVSRSSGNVTYMSLTNKTDPYDYFLEKGVVFWMRTGLVRRTELTVSYRDGQQYSVTNHTEYSLFRETKKYRHNPTIVEGRLRSVSANLKYDSRALYKFKGTVGKVWSPSFIIASLSAELASPGFIDNDFDFVRYRFWMYWRQRMFGFGTTRMELYAGASDRTLPPQRYFTVDFGAGLWERVFYFKTLGETNYSGSRAVAVYAIHDFGHMLFRRSGLPLIKKIPFTVNIHGGAFWTDFRNHPPQPGDGDLFTADKAYTELGIGLGRITPWNFVVNFTWQLSHYATTGFAVTVGGGLTF
jgi:hypothetical protein